MPADFILGVFGFLFATAVGYVIYRWRRVSDDLDRHWETLPREDARRRHPASRSWRRCPICAAMYQGSVLDHVHRESV